MISTLFNSIILSSNPSAIFEAIDVRWIGSVVAPAFEAVKSYFYESGHCYRSDVEIILKKFFGEYLVDDWNLENQPTLSPFLLAQKWKELYEKNQIKSILSESEDKTLTEITEKCLKLLNNNENKNYTITELQQATIQRIDSPKRIFIKYGLPLVDRYLRFREGNTLFIIAAPKTGKSHQIVHWAIQLEQQGLKPEILTWEMKSIEYYERIASYISGVDVTVMGTDYELKNDVAIYSNYLSKINDMDITICDCHGLTVSQLYAKIMSAKMRGRKSILIDYLQKIIDPTAKDLRSAVSNLTSIITQAGAKLNITIVAASQANRLAHDQKITEVWNAKESGSVEADADCLMTLTDRSAVIMHAPEFKPIDIKIVQRRGSEIIINAVLEKHTGRINIREDNKNDNRIKDNNENFKNGSEPFYVNA